MNDDQLTPEQAQLLTDARALRPDPDPLQALPDEAVEAAFSVWVRLL